MTATRADGVSALLPDPGRARTLDELTAALRSLKVWAGNPSYERITHQVNHAWRAAGRPASEGTKRPTVVDCFKPGRRRLNPDLVTAIVQALHPDEGYVHQWRQALRVLGREARPATVVRVQDRLPPDLAGFTGRATEIDQLRQALSQHRHTTGAMAVAAIEGMAGVGKTQLAIHAGHLLIRESRFARTLFVNLRGFFPDPARPPADPAAVLDGFLRLLGVPAHQIPHDLHARTAAYRDRLTGTRTLIVLDNAADVDQVRPLLPEVPGCLTLITSRRILSDPRPATRLVVDVFAEEEAVDHLARVVGQIPGGDDPDAAARITPALWPSPPGARSDHRTHAAHPRLDPHRPRRPARRTPPPATPGNRRRTRPRPLVPSSARRPAAAAGATPVQTHTCPPSGGSSAEVAPGPGRAGSSVVEGC